MALHGIKIKAANKGKLHEDLGEPAGKKLTSAEISKAKRSNSPAVRKRATFAANARKWSHSSTAKKLYGKKSSTQESSK